MFVRRQPVLLSPLWYVFEEAPEDLARYFPKLAQPSAVASQPKALPGAAASTTISNGSIAQPMTHSTSPTAAQQGPVASSNGTIRQQNDVPTAVPSARPAAERQAGADVLPDLGAPSAEASGRSEEAGADGEGRTEAPKAQRVMGPAMPAAEVLAAAAELAEEVHSFPWHATMHRLAWVPDGC